jgi:hypothetical protein
MGYEARASRDHPVAAFRWRRGLSAQSPSSGRAVKVQIPPLVADATSGGIQVCETVGATVRQLNSSYKEFRPAGLESGFCSAVKP